jgi:hypothetical protein
MNTVMNLVEYIKIRELLPSEGHCHEFSSYILIQPNFSSASDAKLTDKIQMEVPIGSCG